MIHQHQPDEQDAQERILEMLIDYDFTSDEAQSLVALKNQYTPEPIGEPRQKPNLKAYHLVTIADAASAAKAYHGAIQFTETKHLTDNRLTLAALNAAEWFINHMPCHIPLEEQQACMALHMDVFKMFYPKIGKYDEHMVTLLCGCQQMRRSETAGHWHFCVVHDSQQPSVE